MSSSGAGSGAGLSFGFSKTSKKSSVVSSAVKIDDSRSSRRRRGSEADDDEDVVRVEDVGNTVLDENSGRAAPAKEYVIPMVGRGKRKHDEANTGGSRGKDGELREMTDLEREAAAELSKDAEDASSRREEDDERAVPLLMQNRLDKADADTLGDVSTLDDYDDMPVECFGQAMLRGMGWKPGMGVGKTNKKAVDPVEFIPRSSGRGLGADGIKAVEMLESKPKRRLRPGEKHKVEVELPRDADGRIRHTRRVGEVLEEKEYLDLKVGSKCLVVSGRHKGLYGKAVSLQIDPPRVILRLAISEQNVDVAQAAIQVVPRREYEQKALSIADDDDEDAEMGQEENGRFTGERDRQSEHRRDEVHRSHHSHRSPPSDHESKSDRKHKKSKKKKKKKHHRDSASSSDDDSAVDSRRDTAWLASQLRVRLVDKRYDGGRRYNSKIVITDVLTPTTCCCRTDSGTYLDDIEQRMLETVIPKEPMAAVMVVAGRYRRQLGRLLSRDKEKYRAIVQLYPDFETVQCTYDEICEYVGRTDHM